VRVSAGSFDVRLQLLASALPFKMISRPSPFTFYGLSLSRNASLGWAREAEAKRRIEWVGGGRATAGYCGVGGTPEAGSIDRWLGWQHSNCDSATPALLGRSLDATTSVLAMPSMSLTQNAFSHRLPWPTADLTVPKLYGRTMQTRAERWNHSAWTPDLVMLALGGDDFNRLAVQVPSNATFTSAFAAFVHAIFEAYRANPKLTMVSVCGQDAPTEAAFDSTDSRCQHCSHVAAATATYAKAHPKRRVHHIFVPCDGSVVPREPETSADCDGRAVAAYLEPRLRDIMDWPCACERTDLPTHDCSCSAPPARELRVEA